MLYGGLNTTRVQSMLDYVSKLFELAPRKVALHVHSLEEHLLNF